MYKLEHMTSKSLREGKYYPLGATLVDGGVNFALYSQNAWEVYLLLFDKKDDDEPSDIIRLESKTRNVFHSFVSGIKAGQLYGYKVRGEYAPERGLRFNDAKLLIDPYAKALTHKFINKDNMLLSYNVNSSYKDLERDSRDNTKIVPKCVVIDDDFDWGGETPLDIQLSNSIIYEAHVKGFTKDPSSKVKNNGTYLGMIEKIPYLKSLGVTTVELLPMHEYYVEDFLANKGLTNYWGYNTVAFFVPEQSYGSQTFPGCQVKEFKTLVKAFHAAGLEIILDVVFNHSAEGNELGPTLSFRGIDNPTYYYLTGDSGSPARYYMNYTGCGNSINLTNVPVIKFVMDCLRYWVEVMHVDGFRFDLASVLGREYGAFYKSSSFFDAISQDPVLSRIKLIAEPWDLGTYEVGNFPMDWSEWNGKFRDTVRKFAKGNEGQLRDMGNRITGSSDLYGDDGRTPYNSINFITCHDGFTLYDLVSYDGKHNDANKENNRDGTDDNNSWNCGEEGVSTNPDILRLRRQQMKNMGCMLFLSLGTPMITGGDEFGRTQYGNNNAYCQDNEISWFDWSLAEKNKEMLDFFRKLIALRQKYPVFKRKSFFTGTDTDHDSVNDIRWFQAGGNPPDWDNTTERKIAFQLDVDEKDLTGKSMYIIYNMDWVINFFSLPKLPGKLEWRRLADTSLPKGKDFVDEENAEPLADKEYYIVNPRSSVVLISAPMK
jgi:isoamylase